MEMKRGLIRNGKGYPLLENGDIDWELTAKEKTEFADKWEAKNSGVKKRKRNTNFTPKKKKRK